MFKLYNDTTMSKIVILPDEVSKKIAAGEVIESPSSVVRELIDNSIDAGSTKITVSIIEGGKKLIEVIDDGEGMSKEDLEKSYLRHATSKIKSVDDLYRITTMGFRGEALASIAEVSELEIISRPKNQIEGHKIIVRGGKLIQSIPTSSPEGTIVRVRDLFFNLPVRRNFLKSDITEYKYILDVFVKKAIAFPEITFELIKDLKTDILLPKSNSLYERIISIYPEIKSLNHKVYEDQDMKIEIFFSKPSVTRPTRNLQQIFVNRRFVESKSLLNAFSKAYENYTSKGSYPIVFCFITINPSLVDVNIHPAKKEIKFKNEGKIYHQIIELITSGLKETDQVIEINESELTLNPIEKSIKKSIETFLQSKANNTIHQQEIYKTFLETSKPQEEQPKFLSNYKKLEEANFIESNYLNKTQSPPAQFVQNEEQEKTELKKYKFIGSIFNTYLIFEVEGEDKILLIDQHALHEKIIYSQKYKELTTRGYITKQNLLMPHKFKISKDYLEMIKENLETFDKLGFSIKIDEDNIEVTSIPSFFNIGIDIESGIIEICEKIKEEKSSNLETVLEKLASIACKSAVKGNTSMTPFEAYKLLEEALREEYRYTCPHGRPTMLYIEKNTLESLFMRR